MLIVAVAWLYVALLMAVAEATHAQGSLLGALVTFVFYGLVPIGLVLYIGSTKLRRRIRAAQAEREAAGAAPAATRGDAGPPQVASPPTGPGQGLQAQPWTGPSEARPGGHSGRAPDQGGHAAGAAIAPEREVP